MQVQLSQFSLRRRPLGGVYTPKIYVSAVLRVLGVADRTQALIAANRLGLRLDS